MARTLSLRIELVAPRCYEELAAASEKQAGRANGSGAGELHGSNLIAIGVVDVRERHGERNPQFAGRADTCCPNDGCDKRNLAILYATARPAGRLTLEDGIQFQPFDVALEDQRSRGAVLAKDRPAGDEHVVVAAGRIDERQPGVHRDVDIAIVFEPGGPQAPYAA